MTKMSVNVSRYETPDQKRDVKAKRPRFEWPIVAIAFGGLLTLVWMAFLLWAVIQAVSWAFD